MMNLVEALENFLKYQLVNGSTDKTIKHYRTHIQYFINYVGNIEVNNINYNMYENYVIFLKNKYKGSQVSNGEKVHLSGCTIKTYVSALKTFLSYCYNNLHILDIDISKQIRMPKYQKKVINILSDSQIKEIIDFYDINDYIGCRNLLAICMMLDCGLRVSEVSNLCFSDFDVDRRCIIVNGKGQKQRFVPFTDFTLKLYLKLHLLSSNKYPFCDIFGNRLNTNGIIQIVKRLKKSLGYTNLHPHLFRHTFATLYLLNGGNPLSLQIILGHTTLYMTENYVHFANELMISKQKQFTPLSQSKFIRS